MPDPLSGNLPSGAEIPKLYELLVAELTDFAIFVINPEGIILTWHPGVLDVLGYTKAEWIGHPFQIIFTPEDRAASKAEKEMEKARLEGRSPDIRWHERKDGSRLYVEGTLLALRDGAGKLVGYAKVMRDITARKLTEDAQKASEERLAFALDAGGGVGTWHWDIPGDRVYCSRRFAELFSVDPELAQTGAPIASFLERIHPEDRTEVELNIRRATRDGSDYAEEYRVVREGHPVRWVYAKGRCHLDASGAPLQFPGVAFDITERKNSEAALRQSEQRARALAGERDAILTQLAEGVIATDSVGRIVLINEAARRIHGVSQLNIGPDEYSEGYNLLTENGDPYPPQDLPLTRAVHGEVVNDVRWRIRRPDGADVLAIGSARPLLGVEGTSTGAVLTLRDDTARRQAEEDLRRQWRTFDTVLSHMSDAASLFDLDCRWTYANAAVLRLLQKPLEEIIGKSVTELIVPAEFALNVASQLRCVIDTGKSVRDELPYTAADNVTRIFEYIFSPVRGAKGTVEAVAAVGRDVTEQRRLEKEERSRQENLRESARLESLGVMAGGIAHDFNNLLTGILGNASMLAEDLGEDAGSGGPASLAREIMFSAERAGDLTLQMLAYSGKGRFILDVLELNTLIQENLILLRASMSSSVDVGLELECEACFIEADRAQIQQVVMNLLINASEAIGDGTGTVTIRTSMVERAEAKMSEHLHTAVAPGNYAQLEVRDSGIGMSPETLKRIFDPFYTTKFTGRGLGLAAVLGIVKGHSGEIEIESRLGFGSTFRVLFPVTRRTPVNKTQPIATGVLSANRRKILVVDDEEVVRRAATVALESRGFQVLRATNGLEALDVLRSHPDIDVIIVDLAMPVMNGAELIPRVQTQFPRLPILVSSGFDESEISSRLNASHVAGYLQKPYSVATVIAKVNEALQS